MTLWGTTGCNDDPGTGTVVFTTWGEGYIEDGIPSDAFLDRWSVKFSKFLVAYNDVAVVDQSGKAVAKLEHALVFDLTQKAQGKPKTLASWVLDAGPWPFVSYQVGPITANAMPGELATVQDVALLQSEQASIHVDGTATSLTGVVKTFHWSFAPATVFQRCHGMQDGKEVEGVLVTNGGTQQVELTVHGDHLFYDDLQSDTGGPRFQAYADADLNQDGEVTLTELEQVPLYTIPLEMGTYGTGALGDVNTLGQYVRTLARTIGHYRGEGSCSSKEVRIER
ncbi:MAG: hypothetical protein ACM3ZE_15330 [Myxococcales bacterium]